MSNYNSTHTGAELDEAIGRVIDGGSIKVQVDTNTTDITDLKGRMTTANFMQVAENGFYVVDSDLNIGFCVDEDGCHAINLLEYDLVE